MAGGVFALKTFAPRSWFLPVPLWVWTRKKDHTIARQEYHRRKEVSAEWSLVKASINAGSSFPVAAAVRDFHEAGAAEVGPRAGLLNGVLRPAVQFGWVDGEPSLQVAEQIIPELAAFFGFDQGVTD